MTSRLTGALVAMAALLATGLSTGGRIYYLLFYTLLLLTLISLSSVLWLLFSVRIEMRGVKPRVERGEAMMTIFTVRHTSPLPVAALRLRLFGTLRNLLGPWHRPVGEVGACWGGYDAPNLPWLGLEALETGKREPNWYLDRMPDRDGWTESYLLLPMGIVGARVEWDA